MSDATKKSEDATVLMAAAGTGDAEAAARLLPLVYEQLRGAAQKALAGERPGHTLSATALVHDAYLKLVGPRQVPWTGRAHFYAAAAQAIRQILIDYARTRKRRGGALLRLAEVGDLVALAQVGGDEILAVDEALQRLEGEDPEAAELVRLRFYAGLSVEQSAEAMGISVRTAARLWIYARAALYRTLST
jgi:RNA polymerase sigma factor (TIGR02999 family)